MLNILNKEHVCVFFFIKIIEKEISLKYPNTIRISLIYLEFLNAHKAEKKLSTCFIRSRKKL